MVADEAPAAPVRNDNPYDDAPNAIAPHSMYFYYLIPGAQPDLRDAEVRSYFYENVGADGKIAPITDVDETVRYLAVNARDELDWPPRMFGGIGDVKWRQKSFIVFLIADDNIKFRHTEAIKVDTVKGNHAFYDGEDRDIEIDFPRTGREIMNMFCCTNHICDDNWVNLGNRVEEKISFDLQLGGFAALYLPDSGGTNMGPPVPPPAYMDA